MPTAGVTPMMRLRISFLLSALFLPLAGGCAVDQRREVALYRSVLEGEHPIQVEYREGEPLTLSMALLLANQHHERLAIGGEDYVQALIEKERALSNFLPTITLVPSYSQADESGDAGGRRVSGGGVAGPNELLNRSSLSTGDGRLDVPVNLNYNAFRGFRDLSNFRRAKADIAHFRSLLLDLQATVLVDVARAFYQVLRAERAVAVLENSATLQDARVREMRMKDVIGAAQKLDVAQIEAQAAGTRASLVAARAEMHNARSALAFATAAPVSDAPLIDQLDVPPAVSPADVFLALAQADRQDLHAANAAIAAARQSVETAFGQYYPSISLNLNAYLSRQSTPMNSEWNALVSLSLPLFTAGRIHADYRTALSQLRQAKEQQSLLRRTIEQDVRIAYENLLASTQRLDELGVEVSAAQTALDVAEGRYQAGLGTYLERLIAQDAELSARLDYANEEFTRKILYLNLLRIAGQLTRPTDPLVLTLPPAVQSPGPAVPLPSKSPVPPQRTQPATLPAEAGEG